MREHRQQNPNRSENWCVIHPMLRQLMKSRAPQKEHTGYLQSISHREGILLKQDLIGVQALLLPFGCLVVTEVFGQGRAGDALVFYVVRL